MRAFWYVRGCAEAARADLWRKAPPEGHLARTHSQRPAMDTQTLQTYMHIV